MIGNFAQHTGHTNLVFEAGARKRLQQQQWNDRRERNGPVVKTNSLCDFICDKLGSGNPGEM